MKVSELTVEQVERFKKSIISMLQQSFEKSFPNESNEVHLFEKRIDSLKNYLSNNQAIFYGVIEQDELMGFIWFFEKDNKTIHINHFVVDERHRGLGIGKTLWNEVEKYGINKQLTDIELFVTKENETAVKFYTKREFKVDRLVMKKRL